MAIPFLLFALAAAAAAGTAAAVISDDSSEKEEQERKRQEQEARERRWAAEVESRRQQARKEEARHQEEARRRYLQASAQAKIQAFMNKHSIHNISLNHVADLAIHNIAACEDLLQKAHINSKAYTDIRSKVSAHEQTLKEIDKLSAQLAQ